MWVTTSDSRNAMTHFFFFNKMSYLAELIMVVVPSWTSLTPFFFHNCLLFFSLCHTPCS